MKKDGVGESRSLLSMIVGLLGDVREELASINAVTRRVRALLSADPKIGALLPVSKGVNRSNTWRGRWSAKGPFQGYGNRNW